MPKNIERISRMKSVTLVVLLATIAAICLAGFSSRRISAQQGSGPGQSVEKLPPDVHPDTLSRMPRAKRTDFAAEDEKQAFDRMMIRSPKYNASRWLGPTGTRMIIPEIAEIYNMQINMLHAKSHMEDKFVELTILVATRESGGKSEWLDHEPDGIKLLGKNVVDIIRDRQDTKGLPEKEAAIIQYGRELFQKPTVSSKTFADLERNFGRKDALIITLFMCYYSQSAVLMRAYDQHTDTRPECVQPHMGCDIGKRELAGTW